MTNVEVKPDHATKIYMERSDIFADAVNYALYNGKQIVNANSLEGASTIATSFVYNGDRAAVTFEKIRDVRKVFKLNNSDHNAYMIYGAENQTHLHYAMPVKDMLYDIMEYMDQINTRRLSMNIPKDKRPDNETFTSDEFLSSWKEDDKLIPVFTIVINFSAKKWEAPVSLHEMFDKDPPERYNMIKELIPDYKIILIDPHQMNDGDLDKFKTNLKTVLAFIKNSDNKNKLINRFKDDQISVLDAEEISVINSCTGANLPFPEKNEVIKVCKAIEDIKNDSRAEGRAEKESEMIQTMRNQGYSEEQIQKLCDGMVELRNEKENNKIMS